MRNGNFEVFSDRRVGSSVSSYGAYDVFGEFCLIVCFPALVDCVFSAFSDAVLRVGFGRAEEKVVWVHTRRIVAPMTNNIVAPIKTWKFFNSVMDLKRHAMSKIDALSSAAPSSDLAVPCPRFRASPHPAIAVGSVSR